MARMANRSIFSVILEVLAEILAEAWTMTRIVLLKFFSHRAEKREFADAANLSLEQFLDGWPGRFFFDKKGPWFLKKSHQKRWGGKGKIPNLFLLLERKKAFGRVSVAAVPSHILNIVEEITGCRSNAAAHFLFKPILPEIFNWLGKNPEPVYFRYPICTG